MDERNKLLDLIIEEKGGSRKDYEKLMDAIAYHESMHTMDPSMVQQGGGPGRGKYQFEKGKDEGGITAARRLRNYYNYKGLTVPKWLEEILKYNTLDASQLTSEQQDMLFLGDMRMKDRADLSAVINGEESITDFWAANHWRGKSSDLPARLKSFNSSFEDYNRKGQETIRDKALQYYSDISNSSELDTENNLRLLSNQFGVEGGENDFTDSYMPQLNQQRDYQHLLNQIRQSQQLQAQQQQQASPVPNQSMPFNQKTFSTREDAPSSKGLLTKYQGGGTHEQNPLGGIPIGPNTVESGETSYDLSSGKYVFSDRLGTSGRMAPKLDTSHQQVSNSYNNQFANGGLENNTGCGGPGQPPCPESFKDNPKFNPKEHSRDFYRRVENLYGPVMDKIINSYGGDSSKMDHNQKASFIDELYGEGKIDKNAAEFISSTYSPMPGQYDPSNRRIPAVDDNLRKLRNTILDTDPKELQEILKKDFSNIGMFNFKGYLPKNVSYLDAIKYYRSYNKYKDQGYTFAYGGLVNNTGCGGKGQPPCPEKETELNAVYLTKDNERAQQWKAYQDSLGLYNKSKNLLDHYVKSMGLTYEELLKRDELDGQMASKDNVANYMSKEFTKYENDHSPLAREAQKLNIAPIAVYDGSRGQYVTNYHPVFKKPTPPIFNPKVQSVNSLNQQGTSSYDITANVEDLKAPILEVPYNLSDVRFPNSNIIKKNGKFRKIQSREEYRRNNLRPNGTPYPEALESFAQGGYMNTIQPLNLRSNKKKKNSSKKK